MTRVESTIVEFELHVHVVTVGSWIITAFVQPVSGGVIVVDVDRDNHVEASLRQSRARRPLLRSTDDARRAKIGVKIVFVMSEFEFAEIDVGVIGGNWQVARDRRIPRAGRVNVWNISSCMKFTERRVCM